MAVRPPIPRPPVQTQPTPPGPPGTRAVPPPLFEEEVRALVRGAAEAKEFHDRVIYQGAVRSADLFSHAVGGAVKAVPLVGRWIGRHLGPRAGRAVRRVAVKAGASPTATEARTVFARAKAMEFFADATVRHARTVTQAYGHLAWTLLFRPGTGVVSTFRDRFEAMRGDLGYPSPGESNAHARLDLQRGRIENVEGLIGPAPAGALTPLFTRTLALRDDLGYPSAGEPNAHARIDLQRGRITDLENRTGTVEAVATRADTTVHNVVANDLPQVRLDIGAIQGTQNAHDFFLGPIAALGLAPGAIAGGIGAAAGSSDKLRMFCRFDLDDLGGLLGLLALFVTMGQIDEAVAWAADELGHGLEIVSDFAPVFRSPVVYS